MYRFIIGIDVSKLTIDASYTSDGHPKYLGQYENSSEGFHQLVKNLKTKSTFKLKNWFICFENTGSYSKLLLEWLISKKIACLEDNGLRISNSLGIKRAKTDKIDSLDICSYAFEKRHKLKPSLLPDSVILELRHILRYREGLVKQKQGLSICIKDKNVQKETIAELSEINDELISNLKHAIKKLDQKIERLIKQNTQIEENYNLVKSVVGIGPINAVNIICATENFVKIKEGRKMAANCGIAPYPKESGKKTSRKRVSQIGNKKLKALLSNAACSAIKHDHQLKAYYIRKMADNKHFGTVLNAVKNKLIHRIFAVIKRKTPYVNINVYA